LGDQSVEEQTVAADPAVLGTRTNLASVTDILLVDDDEKSLVALENTLNDTGQNVVSVRTASQGLLQLLERDFAVILLDVNLPDMNGFEAAALIRQRERTRHVPIIFLTAFSRTDTEVFRGYEIGAVDFMFKPIVPEVLRSKVAVFVDLFRKTEELKRQAELIREAEQREHQRKLAESRQRWEAESLRHEMEKERRVAEALAQKAAELASTVAEREKAEAALQLANSRLSMLSETANRLLLNAEPQTILPDLFKRFCANLGVEYYVNYLLEGERLRLDSYVGLSDEDMERQRWLAIGEEPPGAVARDRRPLIAFDLQTSQDPLLVFAASLGLSAIACYPLLAGERLIGVLAFGSRSHPQLQPDELAMMQVIADQVAMALERARLIAELKGRAEELAEADRRKDEFLAILAHELRNPLAPIVNSLHLVRGSDADGNTARAFGVVERQVRHLVRLIDDLLDVSRITHGKIGLRKERLSLQELAQQAAQTSRPLIQARDHQLTIRMEETPVPVHVDPTRVIQIVSNLLNNAAKYTERGGHIQLTVEQVGGEAAVRVRDNGIGIRPEMLARIFDLFVQADRASDRAQGGLGIGLTLVERLVKLHGGRMEAHSDGPGLGSEFVVRLPLAEPLDEVAETASLQEPAPARALKIVVIEDNPDIRETLREVLELCGHEVQTAGDGQQGIEVVCGLQPHVALIDIGLPGMDGYALAQQLRSMDFAARPRLIAMTGYGQAEDRRRALDAGFDAHLVKPVDPETLTQLLQQPLN
jgi:signal transduction histidine kinase/DNA-binding response OmpR family regulator